MFEIGEKDFTVEALEEIPRPQKRRKVAAVEVEETPEDNNHVPSEAEIEPQRIGRGGRAIRRPARYAD